MKNQFEKKSKKVEFSLSALQANPVTQKQLEGYIEEIVLHKREIKNRQAGIGDCRQQAKDSLGIPGKMLMKLVRENMDVGSIEAEMHELETAQAISQVIDGTAPASKP